MRLYLNFKASILTRIILGSLVLNGCTSLSYISHTTGGHLDLMSQRERIETVLNDEATNEETKEKLTIALRIRAFASKELKLPDNDSYLSYVALDRDYVSWAVFAAPEYSLQPKTWCFWVVGCIPYRGYFSQEKAELFSSGLLKDGYEIYIAPIPAYSTLGWFDDPILSSMLNQGELATANYIFHELAHQEVYIPDDSEFNEAFASAIAELGVIRWLNAENKLKELKKYQRRMEIKQQVYALTRSFRQQLSNLYAEDISVEEKQNKKAAAFSNYAFRIKQLVKQLGGSSSYVDWILKDLNNAKLSAFSTYQQLVPDFKMLYENCNHDFERFYELVASMKNLSKQKRRDNLLANDCSLVSVANF